MYDGLSIEPATTVERIAQELRRALFAGELPPGAPLREVSLAEALGVARSTVREALGVLTAEGLLNRKPNRGVVVAELTGDDVRDVIRARKVLEVSGVRQWSLATTAQREAVHEALLRFEEKTGSGVDPAALTEAHLAVHRAFVGLLGSSRLDQVALGLTREIRLAMGTVHRIRRNTAEQLAEHRRLVSLLDGGSAGAVAAELGAHLDHAERSLLESLALP